MKVTFNKILNKFGTNVKSKASKDYRLKKPETSLKNYYDQVGIIHII